MKYLLKIPVYIQEEGSDAGPSSAAIEVQIEAPDAAHARLKLMKALQEIVDDAGPPVIQRRPI